MWPEQCPADAHDARVLARQIAPITGAVRLELSGRCGQNNAQLMLMMLASWLAKLRQSLGQFVVQASGA